MSSPPVALSALDHAAIVNAVRLELQEAGNPAFIVAVVDADGAAHVAPMVFSAVGPSSDYVRRMLPALAAGERAVIVSRQASRTRQAFSVLDPTSLRKLHLLEEVIEATLAETDGPV
jgi:hypothetical protein